MRTAFAKYEGAGNDFILIDDREGAFTPHPQLIAKLCDRHRGIGADGLMTLRRSQRLDCSMRYFNADGSEGEMCGNGARCFALFAEHAGIGGETKTFDAADGTHRARIGRTEGGITEIEVEMIDVSTIHRMDEGWFVNTGVPHYVEFTEEVDTIDVTGRGRTIRRDKARFPHGTNVDFVQITGKESLRMRTYERGVEAETLACGTGAVAAAVVADYAFGHGADHYRVAVPGGVLTVRFAHASDTTVYTQIRLTGPARRVYRGSFDSENF